MVHYDQRPFAGLKRSVHASEIARAKERVWVHDRAKSSYLYRSMLDTFALIHRDCKRDSLVSKSIYGGKA